MEKVIETYFLIHMNKHIDKHKILHKHHHGGQKHYSTLSAITAIYDKLYYNKENSIISVLLSTDLSAAYDTTTLKYFSGN